MRQLVDEDVREAEVAGAPVRGLTTGEGHLRGHSLADPPLADTRVPLLLPLGDVERDRYLGLRSGRRALELLQGSQQVDALRVGAADPVHLCQRKHERPHIGRRDLLAHVFAFSHPSVPGQRLR